jgi:molybdate transport system substrate-binding protein
MLVGLAGVVLGLGLLGRGLGQLAGLRTGGGEEHGQVTALVAASTSDAVREAADLFARRHGIEVRLIPDDSSRLATQIVQGAPADLFLSANEKWADFVNAKGLAAESQDLLGNSLVIVVPKGNPARVSRPEDLAGLAVRQIAVAGPTVPAGIYAREALKKLGRWEKLEGEQKVVAGENVRATLTYVERGEVEAGVVYATDARISDRVEMVYTFPARTHAPIRYPLVLLQAGAGNESARQLYDFLRSPPSEEVFKKYGFTWLAGK